MGTLIAIGLIYVSFRIVDRVVRMFRARAAGPGWWALLAVLMVTGVGLGIWLAFYFEYQPSPRRRVASFPLPIAVFVWEEDRWTDFVTPTHSAYTAAVANICVTVAAFVAPLLAVFAFLHRRTSTSADSRR
ncbi:MAG: hypothetical protein J0M24_07040 [Verrucomicrobia bacterium]|nr:hypothetical protein [Verrucomicrobiota bacterium]